MNEKLQQELLRSKIVVILRGLKVAQALETGRSLVAAGARFIEVPLNTPGALDCIGLLTHEFHGGNVHIGAGTVLDAASVDAVARAGGEYIISPNVEPEAIRRTKELGLLSIPGFKTPTEAFAAIKAGADVLKLFPCSSPDEIAVLKSVLPKPVFAVGGVTHENKNAYLKTADGIGVGIGIFHPEMDMSELADSAKRFFNE